MYTNKTLIDVLYVHILPMNQSLAIERLSALDQQGRYVFSYRDIAKVFPEDSPRALKAGLARLVSQGFLIRASKGIYVFALSPHKGKDTLERVAKTMRRGEYNYLSLESALSEYGGDFTDPHGSLDCNDDGSQRRIHHALRNH